MKTSIFITSQRFKSLSTLIRSNADIISFFKTNNLLEKKLMLAENNNKILEELNKKYESDIRSLTQSLLILQKEFSQK